MPELEITFDEGGTITGTGTVPYTFDNWLTPTQGDDAIYDWESGSEGGTITGTGCDNYTLPETMDTGANC